MTAATSAPAPGHELQPDAPYPLAVSVVLDPQPSMVVLLRQAAGTASHGAPAGLLAGIRDALRPQARFAAWSLSGGYWTPDCATPGLSMADTSVADEAARMRDTPAAALTSELQAGDGSPDYSPAHWRAAGDQPRRWLNSMADASLDTWAAAEPRWRAAGPLLDREIRRIGTAAVRGGMTALLNSLHPDMSYHDGTFTFTCRQGVVTRWDVGPRRLTLVPMIAGRDALCISFDRPDVFTLGYPVRLHGRAPQAAAESALATILSPVRAAILQAVRQPLTVSQVAVAVHCAPSTASYHLHQLAEAGLITRQKSGPSVRVSRTARGSELVDLLSDLPTPPPSRHRTPGFARWTPST